MTDRRIKHGLRNHRLYHIWIGMKQRCENPKSSFFRLYGQRGIAVCPEWHDFMTFYKWAISHGYSENLSIDRIDNDGNYEPQNCRFANAVTQARNKGNNRLLEHNGEVRCLAEWSEITGIPIPTIGLRIDRGWKIDDALTVKPSKGNQTLERRHVNPLAISKDTPFLTFNGETKCLKEWALITGIKYSTLHTRYRRGWDDERIISTDPTHYRNRGRQNDD